MRHVRKPQRRSDCPINFVLEILGDTWSLLIVRDIVFFGKKTYGDFLRSEEHIATNILAARLTLLERTGIIHKTPYTTDKRKDTYMLTEKGLDLVPILLDFVVWSAKYDPETYATEDFIARAHDDKQNMIQEISELVRNGGCVFPDGNTHTLSSRSL